MRKLGIAAMLWSVILFRLPACGGVVINEIFYHAPDDVTDLEYIELYNSGEQAVDLGGWEFTRGIHFSFPAGAKIEPGGYLVLCRNQERFKAAYGLAAGGTFNESLSNNGERIELSNARGERVDSVKYADRPPWPAAPDGYSSSLERISPLAESSLPQNWAASPLSNDGIKPAGTPGKRNANFAINLPPIISSVKFTPANPTPGQEVRVEADVRDTDGLGEVILRYYVAGSGSRTDETTLTMLRTSEARFAASIPGQEPNKIVRFRIQARDAKNSVRLHPGPNEPRPAFAYFVQPKFETSKIPIGLIINVDKNQSTTAQRRGRNGFGAGMNEDNRMRFMRGGSTSSTTKTPGGSAFIFVNPETKQAELFDFVNVTERSGGYKVHFQKDQPLKGMTAINLIFEYNDRFVLAEPLAYEVYRRAGNAAELTDFVRLSIDGQLLGYHLLVEQPNEAFLRRNKLKDAGNLYKILWYERGIVGQHEKKTNRHTGHQDLVELIGLLEKSSGNDQWAVIKKHFNVEQVITYFAVNMCLSHWDGFFNNYFTYHDVSGTGKWEIYPWDQDKTWGFYDGIQGSAVFFDMPLTFGMAGDAPPGSPRNRPSPQFFGGGAPWWRPGGWFSKPLLANPQFRKHFLARTREILDTIYTEEVFFPIIDAMGERLKDEVRIRAVAIKENPDSASLRLERNLRSLKDHLVKRRRFLLEQPEIRSAGKLDRDALK